MVCLLKYGDPLKISDKKSVELINKNFFRNNSIFNAKYKDIIKILDIFY